MTQTGTLDGRSLARLSPAALAYYHGSLSGRPFYVPRHIEVLDDICVRLATGQLAAEGYRGAIVSMPPRHGKSEVCSRFLPAWFLGTFPRKSVILASYEAEFAASWGRKAREVLEELGPEVFGVKVDHRSSAANNWRVLPDNAKRAGEHGSMSTAGIGGAITGRGADLLVVDDPVKNAVEAHSRIKRESQWSWLTSTALTRLEPDATALVVMTRWHADDLAGRLIAQMEDGADRWYVLNLAAVSGEDDPLGRAPGEALWAERWPLPELESRKRALGSYVWNALYLGKPVSNAGGYFDSDWLPIVSEVPGRIAHSVRLWDTASTEAAGDYSVGALMHKLEGGRFVLADVERGRWSEETFERRVLATAERDGPNVRVRMFQERGSAGKNLVQRFRRLLAGHNFKGVWVTGDKELKARPLSACAERGDLSLLRGAWNTAFIEEAVGFPNAAFDDQVDAAAGAYNDLDRAAGRMVIV